MPTVTLPKVAQYVMNVGKSVKLASIDYFAEASPGISDFLETNSDLFKEIYSSAINYKDSVKRAHTGIKQSKIYEAVDTARKALFEDLKTGNFYNKEREEAMGMKGLDMEMDDMEFDQSMMDFSDDDDSDAAKQSRAFERTTEVASKAQADVTVRSADMVAGTVKASSSMIIAQNERIMASMTSGMANIHAAVSGVGKYLEGPMLSHMQNTKLYQENSLKYQEQITKQLDELLQMQRNLYNAQQEVAASSSKDITLDDIISFEGNPDLTEYGKKIYKNLANALGPEVGMLLGDSFGKNSNPLLMLAGAPLKFIPEYLVKTVVPTTVTKMLEAFDKSISGVFTTMISRFNTWASDDNDNLFTNLLGKLLGIKVERQTSVDPSNFKRGPIPFDGVTKQAIVEIIPGYLRRIESALTGQSERIYNMNSGKWTNIKAIEKEFKDRQEAAVTMSTRDMMQPIFDYINQLKSQTYDSERSRDKANEKIKELTDAVDTLSHKIYNDKGYFRGYKSSYDRDSESYISAAEYYGIDPEVYKEMMGLISGRAGSDSPSNIRNRGNVMHVAQETMSQIASWNQFLKRSEEEYGPIMQLFNNSYDVNLSKRYDPNQKIGVVGGGILGNVLVNSVDEYDKNIFFYLRSIYSIMLADQENGGVGGRGGRPSGGGPRPAIPRTRRTITPEEAFKNLINKDKKEEQKQAQLKVDTERGTSYEDTTENIELQKIIEEKLRTEQQGYTDPEKTFIGQFRKATNFSEKFKAVKDSFDLLTKKPALAITSMLDTADRKIYEMLFGKEDMLDAEERFGKKPGGIVEHMVYRIEETFDKLDDWFREHVFDRVKKWMDDAGITEKVDRAKEWLKDKFRWEDIKGSFRNKFGFAKDQFTGAFRSVGSDIRNSRAYQNYHIRNYTRRTPTAFVGRDIETDTESGSYGDEDAIRTDYGSGLYNKFDYDGSLIQEDDENVQSFARGTKLVTKRGLAIVSPGETIIPATLSKVGQARQLAKEKAFARRFGIKNANFYAEGTATAERETDSPTGVAQTTTEEDYEKVKQTIKTVAKEIAPRESLVDIAVNGLIGSGVSLITGMVGGPLLGAAVGAGVGVVKNSQTVREALFGSEFIDEEGNVIEKKGLISKKLQNNFKKYFPDMKNYGIVGSVAGLFTPLGLVGGLMAGGAIGFLKNNEEFQTYLFGKKGPDGERDGGLISKEFRKKVSEAAPRILIGAAGGALLGPFGLLGNVALGSALGFASTTQEFHDFIFGKEENGERKGGVVGALKEGLIKPLIKWGKDLTEELKEFGKEKILKPLRNFLDPFAQMIKNAITGVADRIRDAFEARVVTPISDFLHHRILEPIGKVLGKIIRAPIALAKGIVSAPFQALGFVGNNIRASQIAKGTATDMTAAQRVQWKKDHPNRRLFNAATGRDRFGLVDQSLATQFEGDEGLDRLRATRDSLALYLDARKEFGARTAKLQQQLVNALSDILNETFIDDPNGNKISVYSYVQYKTVKRINDHIKKGRLDDAIAELQSGRFKYVATQDPEVITRCINTIQELGRPIYEAIDRMKNSEQYSSKFEAEIKKITGRKFNRREFRNLKRMMDKEISTRESTSAEDDEERRKSVAEEQSEEMRNHITTQTDRLVDALNEIKKAFYEVSGFETKYQDTTGETPTPDAVVDDEGVSRDVIDEDTFESSRYTRETAGDRIRARIDEAKENLKSPFREAGRRIRNAKASIGAAWRSAKEEARTGFEAGAEGARNSWSSVKESYNTLFKGDEESGEVGSIGGMITGSKNKVIAMADKAYHMVNIGGKFGIAEPGGKLLQTKASRDIEEAQEQESKYKKKTTEALTQMGKGIIGTVTGLLGSGWQKVKDVKNGIFDSISNILENVVPGGTVIKAIFGLGKAVVGLSLAGHFAAFWTESIWNPIIKPFWENTLKPALSEIGGNIYNFIKEHFPSLGNVLDGIKSTFDNFVANPLATVGDFLVDGLKKFWDYVAEPLGTLLWNAIHSPTLDDFNTKTRTTEAKESQAVNEKGELLYYDEEGNETTEQYSINGQENKPKTTSINVTTSTKETGFINWVTHGFKNLAETKTARHDGSQYTLEKYDNDLIVIRNENTGDFVKFTIGSNEVKVGCKTDADGKPSVMSVIGSTVGMALAGKAIVAGAVAIGAASGSVVPGIGTVIGAAVGLVGGLVMYTIKNQKGYTAEITLKIPDDNADITLCLAQLGWIGDISSFNSEWPQFPEGLSSEDKLSVYGGGVTKGDFTGNRSSSTSSSGGSSGSSRKILTGGRDIDKLSGTAHIYQKSKELANQKFGNSTIGEAGCGPVAATNLINKMGGNMDVGTAASYAESGGFIDSITGGTTTDYMSSILNKSGIPSRETTNKQDIYNNLKQGKPVVMLGNSGMESGTPFGANDHYITAMGLDRQGNVIAEDPDLPDSYRKYKASNVMNDVDVGIATGASRYYGKKRPGSTRFGNKYAAKRRRKSGRALMVNTVMSDGGGSASAASDVVYNWAFRAADCIGDGESSGNYAAINKNDSGNGMSVGKYQFHRGRAKAVLTDIANYLVTYGVYTFDSLKELLGQNLYDYVTASTLSDYRYYPNDAEVEALKIILDSDVGHERQDYKCVTDVENLYWPKLKALGLNLETQEDIVIYFCNTLHMMGEGNKIPSNIINAAKKTTGKAVGDLTLDDIHTAMMATEHGKGRKTRYEKNYNYLKATSPGGVSSSYYDDIISDTGDSSYSSIMEGVSEANSEAVENSESGQSILSMLGEAIKTVFTNIYGDSLMRLFGYSSDSSTSNSSTGGSTSSSSSSSSGSTEGSVATSAYNANSAQKALPAWLKSIQGKIRYSDTGVQDPDQGQASCASTVEWAYNKALGMPRDVSDLAYQSMYDYLNKGFQYVYKSETPASAYGGSDFSLETDLPKLQAGDILYYRTKKAADPNGLNRPMGIGHVEMYDGEGHRVGHGSGYGPQVKDISSNASNLVAALRYGPFIDGEQVPFTNPDGTPGVYESDTKIPAANQFTTRTVAAMGRSSRGGIANKARKNLYKKYKQGKRITESDIKNYMDLEASDDSGITGNSRYSIQRSGIARTPTLTSAVSYEDFLNVIIELLTIIAKNSDKLSEIVTLLSKNGVNLNQTDVANVGNSRSAQARLKDAIRKSGLGRPAPGSSGNSSPYGGSAYERDPNDIKYVVGLMESLAKS